MREKKTEKKGHTAVVYWGAAVARVRQRRGGSFVMTTKTATTTTRDGEWR